MPATCQTDYIFICGAPIRPFSSPFVTACRFCYKHTNKHTIRVYMYRKPVFLPPVFSHRPRSENTADILR